MTCEHWFSAGIQHWSNIVSRQPTFRSHFHFLRKIILSLKCHSTSLNTVTVALCFITNMITKLVVVMKCSLALKYCSQLIFVLPATSPPGSLYTHFLVLKTEALAAENVEINLANHVSCWRKGLSKTATEPEK